MSAATRMARAALLAAGLLAAVGAGAQHFNLGDEPWQEDTPPPPPEFSTRHLIDVEMPPASSIKMGIPQDSIVPNTKSGIVRYVVVARGRSAVNASYEGIRCATGQYRVYARKVQDEPWREDADSEWRSIRVTDGAATRYRWELARDGMCVGTTVRGSANEIARQLRSGNEALYR